ncbi:Uncharacterised protein [Candidatus Gugararchaeum adminiculabundum]|nr:Uncharacterised protein [Candidatus Gugararchaeum adminiculabundum]
MAGPLPRLFIGAATSAPKDVPPGTVLPFGNRCLFSLDLKDGSVTNPLCIVLGNAKQALDERKIAGVTLSCHPDIANQLRGEGERPWLDIFETKEVSGDALSPTIKHMADTFGRNTLVIIPPGDSCTVSTETLLQIKEQVLAQKLDFAIPIVPVSCATGIYSAMHAAQKPLGKGNDKFMFGGSTVAFAGSLLDNLNIITSVYWLKDNFSTILEGNIIKILGNLAKAGQKAANVAKEIPTPIFLRIAREKTITEDILKDILKQMKCKAGIVKVRDPNVALSFKYPEDREIVQSKLKS